MAPAPSIVPHVPTDQDVYLVLEDFGPALGRAWCEISEEDANRARLMWQLMEGQYERPSRIVAFNTVEGWSRDVTVEIADELRRRFVEFDEVPPSMLAFLERVVRR